MIYTCISILLKSRLTWYGSSGLPCGRSHTTRTASVMDGLGVGVPFIICSFVINVFKQHWFCGFWLYSLLGGILGFNFLAGICDCHHQHLVEQFPHQHLVEQETLIMDLHLVRKSLQSCEIEPGSNL